MRVAGHACRRSASAKRSAATTSYPERIAENAAARALAPTIASLRIGLAIAAIAATELIGRILLAVLHHLSADGLGDVDAQLVGQRERVADDVGQLFGDGRELRRVAGQLPRGF